MRCLCLRNDLALENLEHRSCRRLVAESATLPPTATSGSAELIGKVDHARRKLKSGYPQIIL